MKVTRRTVLVCRRRPAGSPFTQSFAQEIAAPDPFWLRPQRAVERGAPSSSSPSKSPRTRRQDEDPRRRCCRTWSGHADAASADRRPQEMMVGSTATLVGITRDGAVGYAFLFNTAKEADTVPTARSARR